MEWCLSSGPDSTWSTLPVRIPPGGILNVLGVGSERQRTTGASGTRLKEAASINKSLSTLGLVIMSLGETRGKKPKHVPYRDSKLTFLLQDSLGGNANAVMISNISPSTKNINETLSTLRFARGAKRVKNKAVANHDCVGNISSLKAEITHLKQELKIIKEKVDKNSFRFVLRAASSKRQKS